VLHDYFDGVELAIARSWLKIKKILVPREIEDVGQGMV
jgi:hypothetical protein